MATALRTYAMVGIGGILFVGAVLAYQKYERDAAERAIHEQKAREYQAFMDKLKWRMDSDAERRDAGLPPLPRQPGEIDPLDDSRMFAPPPRDAGPRPACDCQPGDPLCSCN